MLNDNSIDTFEKFINFSVPLIDENTYDKKSYFDEPLFNRIKIVV